MSTFNEWMEALDREVCDRAGVSVHDLADWNFRDAFEDEVSVSEAADDILEENGWGR